MSIDTQQREMEVMQQGGQLFAEEAVDVWTKQGHHLTGGWENSLKYSIIGTGQSTTITGTMNLYGAYLNAGVSNDRIPYDGETKTGAGTSQYIQGLKNFWMLRGLNEKEALRAAFATAKNHKKDGLPSAGSYRFSETGQRTQFIEIADNEISPKIDEYVSDGLDAIVDDLFHETKSETI